MRMWDEGKMADLVSEQSRLKGVLADLSTKLNDQRNSDRTFDEIEHAKYQNDQLYHAQIVRELGVVSNDIDVLDHFRPARVQETKESPLARFLRRGQDGLESDEIEAYLSESANGEGMAFRSTPQNAVQSDDSSGQETVPETIPPSVIDRLAFFGGVARMAHQFRTSDGGEYRFLQHDEVAAEGEIIGTQATNVSDQDIADFTQITFGARTCSSKRVFITREMLQDTIVDVASFASARLVRRMGRTWDKTFTTATGAQESNGAAAGPRGVVDAALPGVTAASATAVTYDELVDLIYVIDRAYRLGSEMGEGGLSSESMGRTGFIMSDGAEQLLRKLKDSDGRPIWWPGATGNMAMTGPNPPGTIMGYPYEVSGPMAAPATGTVPILFGNFSYYGIRTVAAVEIFRFQDSNTMRNNSIAVQGFSRRDGRVTGVIRPKAAPEPAASRTKCEAFAKLTMK